MKIVLKNITKKYKNKEVLSHLNFEFDNKIYAFIGHNGSGKSTLMRIITGLIEPTQGEVIFYQNDKIIDYKKVKFGYLSQEFNAFKEFTVYEQLEYFAIMKKINKKVYSNEIKKVLVEVNLWENKDVKCKNLSGGMIRRLGIAQTLLGSPDVIILDEPVVGLDPDERMRFMEIIKSIQLDIPIIFSTHIIDDISSLSPEIIFFKNGQIKFNGSSSQFIDIAKGKIYLCSRENLSKIKERIASIKISENTYRVIASNRLNYDFLQDITPCMEDAYIYLNQDD
ncbi:MAG: ATP-binding cassette domain-containing protein [Catenibacterium mitsuokai]|uniref:ATP-binding cassette domain-containing protein n=1 Tax=Catenibacterium TaxID=135858 RepID=UPI002432A287|nr:ATP-binding cassette domain-containing protein [Catenibacterium mitsuokai]MDD6595852.1 ATP-binding cassette domain-containing protein [Catenibacterium mitsuokai]MDY3677423.1 ATP-binding cassette domain-containing protein [Catenibacterium mitsuokai]MDY4079294.1 ATP-binding cassette domain-containing protein [Clostridium sp.]